MGDLLFAIANLAAQAGHRAGVGAAQGEREVHEALRALEEAFHARGRSVHEATLEEMEAEWQEIKRA